MINPFLTSTPAWRRALMLWGSVLLWTLFWYRDTILGMAEIWAKSGTFTHGFVVPPLAAWLAWRRRQIVAGLTPVAEARWLMLALPLACAWILGDLTATNSVTHLALVALIVVSVPVCLGWAVTREFTFPLAFLFFAAPVGEFLLPLLMDWTANFTVTGLRLSGVPVYREGMHFVIPSGRWSVVEACSGVRYLIASMMVGALFAHLNYQSTRRRFIFFAVSILVPIVANWVRAYMIVMLGHLSGNTIAVGIDHLIYGWVFFGLVIFLMFAIGSRWAEPEPAPENPTILGVSSIGPSAGSGAGVILLFAGILAIPPLTTATLSARTVEAPVLPLLALDAQGWRLASDPDVSWEPGFANPDAMQRRSFQKDGVTVGVYLGYYRGQNYDHKLITSTNRMIAAGVKTWAVSRAEEALPEQHASWPFRRTMLRDASGDLGTTPIRLTVLHTYWINGRLTTSPQVAKLWMALNLLAGRGDDAAVLILYARGDQASVTEALTGFAVDAGPVILDVLSRARN